MYFLSAQTLVNVVSLVLFLRSELYASRKRFVGNLLLRDCPYACDPDVWLTQQLSMTILLRIKAICSRMIGELAFTV
jgi:hypothetical protein